MQHSWTRRGVIAALPALAATAGCTTVSGSQARGQKIDSRVDAAFSYLYQNVPGAQDLASRSVGILMMPLITEAGLGFGGAYGRGALRIGGATVDYYAAASGSFGLQIGAQQYAHALFFLTEAALARFRSSAGFSVGGDLEVAVASSGVAYTADTTTTTEPIVAMIFGQAGLIAGATLEGTKYTRIYP
jgi:lipid-binding SYLF domain-containing protein